MTLEDVDVSSASVVVDSISRSEWADVLHQFADASLFQSWEFGQAWWGAQNLSRIVVRDRKGDLLSAAQVRILRVPVLGVGIAYVRFGPMWKVSGKERNISGFRAGLRALVQEYVIGRGLILRVRPNGFREIDLEMPHALQEEGLEPTRGIHREPGRTILVDLSPSESELRARLRKGWRRTLRLAESVGLQVDARFDSEQLDVFAPLYWETVHTKKFTPGSSFDDFVRTQRLLDPGNRMRVSIASHGGLPVAGAVASAYGETAIGHLAASGAAGRKLNASYLVQWDEVLWAKKRGMRFLDLSGINPQTNPGGYTFKSGLRGQEVTALGVFDAHRNQATYCAALALERGLRWRRLLSKP